VTFDDAMGPHSGTRTDTDMRPDHSVRTHGYRAVQFGTRRHDGGGVNV